MDVATLLEVQGAELDDLIAERERVEQEIQSLQAARKRTVTKALYDIQDGLHRDEEVTLINAEEVSRGGHYTFREVLTSDGVVARDVTRHTSLGGPDQEHDASSDELYDWAGTHWNPDVTEPLDIETEYLVGQRGTPAYIDNLADRVQTRGMDNASIPAARRHYD